MNATDVSEVLFEIAADLSAAAHALGADAKELAGVLHRGNAGRALLTGEANDSW
jgi:hypothetical protein